MVCSFSTEISTAVSYDVLLSGGVKTVAVEVWGEELNGTVVSSAFGRTALLNNINGRYRSWDGYETTALPYPDNFYVHTIANAQYLILNITQSPSQSDPFSDVLTAVLPGSLFTNSTIPDVVCSNEFLIANITETSGALISIFNALGGEGWTSRKGWLEDFTSPCTWHGVACGVNSTVQGLFLQKNNVQTMGGIPTTVFGSLGDTLRSLHLGNNPGLNVSADSIPTLSLPLLETLDLHNTGLFGSLPEDWSQHKSLKNVLLYANDLTGTIPYEWGNLTSLTTLLLQDNRLSGALPDWGSPFRNSTAPIKLKKLWAYGNSLNETFPHEDRLALQESAFPFNPSKYSNSLRP